MWSRCAIHQRRLTKRSSWLRPVFSFHCYPGPNTRTLARAFSAAPSSRAVRSRRRSSRRLTRGPASVASICRSATTTCVWRLRDGTMSWSITRMRPAGSISLDNVGEWQRLAHLGLRRSRAKCWRTSACRLHPETTNRRLPSALATTGDPAGSMRLRSMASRHVRMVRSCPPRRRDLRNDGQNGSGHVR